MEEQRKHPRYEVRIPAEAGIDETVVPVDVIEISCVGLRLESRYFFSPDELMSVTIVMGRSIFFNGWVAWVLEKYSPKGCTYHTGIRIESITDTAAGLLDIKQHADMVQEMLAVAKPGAKQSAGRGA